MKRMWILVTPVFSSVLLLGYTAYSNFICVSCRFQSGGSVFLFFAVYIIMKNFNKVMNA